MPDEKLPSNEECWNCKYFIYLQPIEQGWGLCLRYPPVAMTQTGEAPFPKALNIDWCGEWKPIPNGNVQHEPTAAERKAITPSNRFPRRLPMAAPASEPAPPSAPTTGKPKKG